MCASNTVLFAQQQRHPDYVLGGRREVTIDGSEEESNILARIGWIVIDTPEKSSRPKVQREICFVDHSVTSCLTVDDTLSVGPLAPAAADRHAHHGVALSYKTQTRH